MTKPGLPVLYSRPVLAQGIEMCRYYGVCAQSGYEVYGLDVGRTSKCRTVCAIWGLSLVALSRLVPASYALPEHVAVKKGPRGGGA